MKTTIASVMMAAIATVNAITAPIHVNPEMRMLADQDGRAIIFHGVNVVYKNTRWTPSFLQMEILTLKIL